LKLSLETADEFFDQGSHLINQGLFAQAAQAFFSAVPLRWTFTEAHIELGITRSALKQYDQAYVPKISSSL
jgi:Flp pilus assembly protein TadD